MPNRLRDARSPYLLQHADNPVDWWEWGDDAFAEARRRDVPVLLSVGYAACHWCHVMAHESFEDEQVAAYLNAHFVAIKVDREERPDVDAVYMESVQALTGQGGWPMTAFLTPGGKPFYAGTYFPPQSRHGLPSFSQLLQAVDEAWTQRRGDVTESAERIGTALGGGARVEAGGGPPGADRLDAAVARLTGEFDPAAGGFGGAPKFPPSMVLEFLLRHHVRTGDHRALAMVEATCERMARGGLYDQLGGGFARYSVDAGWVVPHFEKMLYDNALLLRVYAHLWRVTGSALGARVVRETAGFLLRELRTAEGGFASSLDADSPPVEGAAPVEGAFYVWTPAQLRDVLGDEDGAWAAALLGVTDAGTFEHGASTLQLLRDPDDSGRWERVRGQLFDARLPRPAPGRDDKVVAAWNGLAIAALAEAGALFGEPSWVDAAVGCADLLVRLHLDERGRLLRVSRDGVAGTHAGVLEDYADVAEGFLTLVAVTGDPVWLSLAEQLLDVVLVRFADPTGGFFDTGDDATDARLAGLRRPQDPTDNATPSGWSAAAGALLGFAAYTGSDRHRTAAGDALGIYDALAARAPRFAGWGLAVAEAWLAGPAEVAVVGPRDDPRTAVLHAVALRSGSPGAMVVAGDPDDPASAVVPLLRDRGVVGGAPAAYVCRGFVCELPATDPDRLAAQLAGPAA
ncbi:thioredoxin domain-containing protein [Jiangella aurantiaca]|uniref:Thioredoxin domain-containing protein n=1 Tax=Jiangella aurantiaca TaxID=2530373 RepID=A0A4V2YR62_9ACTN|nr:thioredoxin domain-containing protein [Jiangella aurantiaca]TDD64647.1 thioredoxin domain-containing protein [Jiangella aurantiaca]